MLNLNLYFKILALLCIFFTLSYEKKKLRFKILSTCLIIVISRIIDVTNLPILIETAIYLFLFSVLLFCMQITKSQFLYKISYLFFLCSVRYSVHGFFVINSISFKYESIIASVLQILCVLYYLFQKNHEENISMCFLRYIIAGGSFILIASRIETPIIFYLVVSAISCILILNFAYLFAQNQIQKAKITEMKDKEEILKLARSQYKIALEQAEKYTIQKHDFIHHMHMLYTLLEQENNEQAKKYLSTITEEIQVKDIPNYSTNLYLNALLQYKTNTYSDIYFDIEMHITKEPSSEIIDFCLLLSHLIDYAIKKIHENNLQKKIQIHAIEQNNTILLEIITPPFISKEKTSELYTMLTLISKYNGTMQEITDTNYHIQVSFTLQEKV